MNIQRNRILILHGSSDLYGASKILLTTISFLIKRNNTVIVVLSEDGPLANEIRKLGVEVLICRLGILRRKYFTPLGIINRLKVISKAKVKLKRLVVERRIDIIYSNTTAVLIGAIVAKNCKIKHLWHVHEIIKSPSFFVKFIGWCLNKYSDAIVVVSEEVKKHWSQYISERKIYTIHNGIDYSEFLATKTNLRKELCVNDDHIIIGMIGRVNSWKGQIFFLKIASIIKRKYSNVRFVMVGDAFPGYEYLYDEIKSFIIKENLNDVVFNLGYRKDIANILKGLDIFVLPSILPDPLPTVVLEAMASGKPVIATKHGGALEMVEDNQTGILIPWDDEEEAAASFAQLISDENKRKSMGEQGRNRALKYFSVKSYEENFIKVIDVLN